MGPTLSGGRALSEKRKGKPALSGDPPVDEALLELAEVLWEIARNGTGPEVGQEEASTFNPEDSAKDECSSD